MDHTVLVGIFDGIADAADQLRGLARRQRPFGKAL